MESEALIAQYQIEPYRGSYEKLRNSAVMFTGSPRTSNTKDRILLSHYVQGNELATDEDEPTTPTQVEEGTA